MYTHIYAHIHNRVQVLGIQYIPFELSNNTIPKLELNPFSSYQITN